MYSSIALWLLAAMVMDITNTRTSTDWLLHYQIKSTHKQDLSSQFPALNHISLGRRYLHQLEHDRSLSSCMYACISLSPCMYVQQAVCKISCTYSARASASRIPCSMIETFFFVGLNHLPSFGACNSLGCLLVSSLGRANAPMHLSVRRGKLYMARELPTTTKAWLLETNFFLHVNWGGGPWRFVTARSSCMVDQCSPTRNGLICT